MSYRFFKDDQPLKTHTVGSDGGFSISDFRIQTELFRSDTGAMYLANWTSKKMQVVCCVLFSNF
jgi:hypothetical protein